MGNGDNPSTRVVEQRVRNRVIDVLELAADVDEQRQYAKNVPFVYIPFELLSQWGDWVSDDPRTTYPMPDVYSSDEVVAMGDFHAAVEVASRALNDFIELELVLAMPEWIAMRDVANSALAVFARRGPMSEEVEEPTAQ